MAGTANTKTVGRTEMSPAERYLLEIDFGSLLAPGQTISEETAVLREMPLGTDVSSSLLEAPTVSGATVRVAVKQGIKRGYTYELEMTVTAVAGSVVGSTWARRIEIKGV